MRLVFVAWNGSEHTRRWVSFFARRGDDVHVVTCGDREPSEPGYTVHDLGPPKLGKIGYLAKIPAARRVIRSLDPDLVHAHHVTSYGLIALASGRRPLVVTAHGSDVLVSPRNPLLRRVVARVLRAAALITVPSQHMAAAVEALTAPREKRVVTFQYGVDVARLVELGDRVRSSSTPAAPRIVCARHLWPVYRVDLLIRALARMRDAGHDFTCDIAGDGPERHALEGLTRELLLDARITFLGHLSPLETQELMAASDVYVSVAESDGVSISLLEALALGLVPVLSDIPANRDWIEDGASGMLVQLSAEGIADGIVRATRLDRATAARTNRETVRARADRATNLGAFAELLDELVGSS
jgi:glycosyltransferase involved in cell wall biosynthesis